MAEVALAFLWHQHQPYYPDDVAGHNPMPWVRLHGVKDYYGMALQLLEFPEMRCTINLVPSLLVQLSAYTERGATDRFYQVSQIPADSLSESDALYLLDHFFMANAEHMVRPYARYAELYQRRGAGSAEVLRRFAPRDLRDLQVWFNLAWIHPLAFERDDELRDLQKKSRHFSEADKNRVLEKHLEILRQVIPLHRQLAERGQAELTTTPFYHPILPLLFDKRLAREALPDAKLPRYTGGYPEDAVWHVRRALEEHEQVFGRRPHGMWPAEGSVCQAMIPLLARQGIRWIATDEEILSHSTQDLVGRDSRGHARNPELMYRPYAVEDGSDRLAIVFRDHALSDLIGFHYQWGDPAGAAEDFLARVRAIGQAVQGRGPVLVPVILDGENCWEHYPGGGVAFLRALYARTVNTPGIRPVSIGAQLEAHPPHDTLPRLFAGSWIHHNFAIWVGHEEDNTAWDLLHRTREHLRQRDQGYRSANSPASRHEFSDDIDARVARAWEEIYIAEGSDWFWWYGDDHSSPQDALFDYLFRKHLQNVYTLLGDTPPADLARPIRRRADRSVHTEPRALLQVRVDGRQSFFEWASAGHYACQDERGTMAMVTPGPIRELFFGFDLTTLFLRIDFQRPARTVLAEHDALRVCFADPPGWELRIEDTNQPACRMQLLFQGATRSADGVHFAAERIAELALPFDLLGVKVNEPVHFFVELVEGGQSRDRVPRESTITLARPAPDFEQQMWDV